MAAYPWIVPHVNQGQHLDDFPHLKQWFERIAARPASQRGDALVEKINTVPTIHDDEARKILFGQTATNLPRS